MLFGTRKLSVLSVAPTNSTAENQRLKVSGLTWGFSAADNFCQSWLHFSSIGDLLTVLHNRHTGGCTGDSELGPNETFPERRIRSKHQKTGKNAKISKIRGKTGTQLPGKETWGTRIDISFMFSILQG